MNNLCCEDCGDEVETRRARCKKCGKLVCGWCYYHVHGVMSDVASKGAGVIPCSREEAPDELIVLRQARGHASAEVDEYNAGFEAGEQGKDKDTARLIYYETHPGPQYDQFDTGYVMGVLGGDADKFMAMRAEVEKLRKENNSFRFALELYADKDGWMSMDDSGDEDTFIYVDNGWELAKEALQEFQGSTSKSDDDKWHPRYEQIARDMDHLKDVICSALEMADEAMPAASAKEINDIFARELSDIAGYEFWLVGK